MTNKILKIIEIKKLKNIIFDRHKLCFMMLRYTKSAVSKIDC